MLLNRVHQINVVPRIEFQHGNNITGISNEKIKLDVHLIVVKDNSWYRMDRVVSMNFWVIDGTPDNLPEIILGPDFEGRELLQSIEI